MDSPGSAVQQSLHQPSGYMRASESESSIDVGTMRGRQSVESDRGSLPATLQGIKQGESGLQMKGGDVLSSTFETCHIRLKSAAPRKIDGEVFNLAFSGLDQASCGEFPAP